MFARIWDSVTDVAETIATVTGNDEAAELIDQVDDIVEEFVGEGEDND